MELVLIRHARPEVSPGICYGSLDLALAKPMSPTPARMAAALEGVPPARIVSSPAARARETAAQLACVIAQGGPMPDCHIEPRLRELDFGTWEGQPWDGIPRADLDLWAVDLMGARPHGGENATQVMARVTAWADGLEASREERLWVVTHAGPMRMLAAHWLGLALAQTLQWELAFGASCLFRLGEPGGRRLGWWNRLAD